MLLFPKFVVAAPAFFLAYCLTRLSLGEILRLNLGPTLPALAVLLLVAAWLEGYLSRGGLQRFIRQELPPKIRNMLLGSDRVSQD